MSDYSELKRLAEAATSGPWSYDGSYVCPARVEGGTTYVETWRSVADCAQPENTKFIAAANPAAVLALIAENERLSTQVRLADVSAEVTVHLAVGAAATDALLVMHERDQLKAENEALRKECARLAEDNQALLEHPEDSL